METAGEHLTFWELVARWCRECDQSEEQTARRLAAAVICDGLVLNSVHPGWRRNREQFTTLNGDLVGYSAGSRMMLLRSEVLRHLQAVADDEQPPSRELLRNEFILRGDFRQWCAVSGIPSPVFWRDPVVSAPTARRHPLIDGARQISRWAWRIVPPLLLVPLLIWAELIAAPVAVIVVPVSAYTIIAVIAGLRPRNRLVRPGLAVAAVVVGLGAGWMLREAAFGHARLLAWQLRDECIATRGCPIDIRHLSTDQLTVNQLGQGDDAMLPADLTDCTWVIRCAQYRYSLDGSRRFTLKVVRMGLPPAYVLRGSPEGVVVTNSAGETLARGV